MSTTLLNGKPDPDVSVLIAGYRRDMQALQGKIKQDRDAGEAALRRLLPIAQGNSGQCRSVAAVLLGCYNGSRFPLNLTNLRGLDYPILDDLMTVLRMDANAQQEVHYYFDNGSRIFEQLAEDWGFNTSAGGSHG